MRKMAFENKGVLLYLAICMVLLPGIFGLDFMVSLSDLIVLTAKKALPAKK